METTDDQALMSREVPMTKPLSLRLKSEIPKRSAFGDFGIASLVGHWSLRHWSFLLCLFAGILPSHAAVSLKAQFERATVMAGETVTLQVIVEGGRPEQAETFPAIAGVTVQYRGNSQNITSINGQTS